MNGVPSSVGLKSARVTTSTPGAAAARPARRAPRAVAATSARRYALGVAGEHRLAAVVDHLHLGRRPAARGPRRASRSKSGGMTIAALDLARRPARGRARSRVANGARRRRCPAPRARRPGGGSPAVSLASRTPSAQVLHLGREDEAEERAARRAARRSRIVTRERVAQRRAHLADEQRPEPPPAHARRPPPPRSMRRKTSVIGGCSMWTRASARRARAAASVARSVGVERRRGDASPPCASRRRRRAGGDERGAARGALAGGSRRASIAVAVGVALRGASSGVALAISRPASMNDTQSQYSTSSRKCVVTKTVTPALGLLLDAAPRRGRGCGRRRRRSARRGRGRAAGAACERQAGALADAGGQVLGLLALRVAEREALAQRAPAALELGAVEAVEAGVELDVLAQRQPLVEAHFLAHVADVVAHAARVAG